MTGAALREIARMLNQDGVPTPWTGKKARANLRALVPAGGGDATARRGDADRLDACGPGPVGRAVAPGVRH